MQPIAWVAGDAFTYVLRDKPTSIVNHYWNKGENEWFYIDDGLINLEITDEPQPLFSASQVKAMFNEAMDILQSALQLNPNQSTAIANWNNGIRHSQGDIYRLAEKYGIKLG